jgi:hypothetical protein
MKLPAILTTTGRVALGRVHSDVSSGRVTGQRRRL